MSSVLSRNYFLLENKVNDFVHLKKLNQNKVRWIVREIDGGGSLEHGGLRTSYQTFIDKTRVNSERACLAYEFEKSGET